MSSPDNLEYQFIQTQLQANRFAKGVIHNQIAGLMQLVQQNRQALTQIETSDRELEARLEAMPHNNQMVLVNYAPIPEGT